MLFTMHVTFGEAERRTVDRVLVEMTGERQVIQCAGVAASDCRLNVGSVNALGPLAHRQIVRAIRQNARGPTSWGRPCG